MNYSKPFCLFRMNPSIFRDLLGLAAGLAISAMAQAPGGEGFGAPEQAVTALREGLRAKDADRLKAIFGPEVEDLVNPDRVQATNEFQMVSEAIEEAHSLVNAGEGRLLLEYGKEKNLFPVPLLKVGDRWFFDTAQGKEEVINRRIGRNELDALETIRTYVQAQREYASADRDGDEVLEYAQKFRSNEGTRMDCTGRRILTVRSVHWAHSWRKPGRRDTEKKPALNPRRFTVTISVFSHDKVPMRPAPPMITS